MENNLSVVVCSSNKVMICIWFRLTLPVHTQDLIKTCREIVASQSFPN